MHPLEAAPPGVECECVGKHVPLPQILHDHHIVPTYMGGSNDRSNRIWLCPTTHYNIHDLLREYEKYQGTPPGYTRKHYSKYVQELAKRGWDGRKKKPLTSTITSDTVLGQGDEDSDS